MYLENLLGSNNQRTVTPFERYETYMRVRGKMGNALQWSTIDSNSCCGCLLW